jgi:serine/threonine protein kinase
MPRYKAGQEGLDRVVALKILPEEFAHDVKFALRFTREARTLAKLNHPNIVSVCEFGNVEDTYYFLMEFVDGPTLREFVRAGHLAPEHALSIVSHLCDALQVAHDKGVIHRGIQPENILMASDSSVKIADFGLLRIVGNENRPTALTRTHPPRRPMLGAKHARVASPDLRSDRARLWLGRHCQRRKRLRTSQTDRLLTAGHRDSRQAQYSQDRLSADGSRDWFSVLDDVDKSVSCVVKAIAVRES